MPIFSQTLYNSFDRATGNGQGTIEATVVSARQIFSFDGESQAFTNHLGFRGGYSILDYLELKVSWTRAFLVDSDFNNDIKISFIEFSPKFIFPGGKFAISLPIGRQITKFDFGGGSETDGVTYLTPEVMFTHQFNPKFDLGANIRLVQPTGEENSDNSLVGININAGFSNDSQKWMVRPEIGLLFEPGEEGLIWSPGVSFNYYIRPMGSENN